jgi:hypothetical protein
VVEGARLWARRLSGAAFLLLLIGVISLWQAEASIYDNLDPGQNHLLELEAGQSGEVSLTETGKYVALRIEGDDGAELRLLNSTGEEEEGATPGVWEANRVTENGTNYIPIKVFTAIEAGTYTLHNDGNSTLWLVDDVSAGAALFKDRWFVLMFLGCCLGLPLAGVALFLAIIDWRRAKTGVSPVVIPSEGRLPTTDELYRQYRDSTQSEAELNVPDPFVGRVPVTDEPQREESETDWRGWDEG